VVVVAEAPTAESLDTLGTRIRVAREAIELKQADLATRAGVGRSVINDLEAGRPRDLGVSKFYRLAAVLGVSIEWLLHEPDLCPRMRADDWYKQIDWTQVSWAALQDAGQRMHPEDVRMLAGVHYRGVRPTTPAQWRLLLSMIRLVVEHAEAWSLDDAD